MNKIKYVFVSQGIKIYETFDREFAYRIVNEHNEDWEEYKQQCLDNNEEYVDNEITVYEEVLNENSNY